MIRGLKSFVIICLSIICAGIAEAQTDSLRVDSLESERGIWSFEGCVNASSMYNWRGYMLGGFNLQPEVTINYARRYTNIYVDAWFGHAFGFGGFVFPSREIESCNELDITFGFERKGLEFSLAGYFSPLYGSESKMDWTLDASIGYTFDFGLGAKWNTCLREPTELGDKTPFSTYIMLFYERSVWELDLGVRAGFVPWKSPYIDCIDEDDKDQVVRSNMFHTTLLGLDAGHTFSLKDDRFTILVGLHFTYNPTINESGLYVSAGIYFDVDL